MSHENVEVVHLMYEAFHSGDADGALTYFDPDVVIDASRRVDGHCFSLTLFSPQRRGGRRGRQFTLLFTLRPLRLSGENSVRSQEVVSMLFKTSPASTLFPLIAIGENAEKCA